MLWYRDNSESPNESLAIFFGRFYADDTALRLYAAGEHLAKAIVSMLEISNQDLQIARKAARSDGSAGEQITVGKFLTKMRPNHSVTAAIVKLIGADEWQKTITYRNH